MTYMRGNKEEFDAWERLGNAGWNWDALLPYFIKSENYTAANASQVAAGATYDLEHHGLEGPVKVGYPAGLTNTSSTDAILEGWSKVNIPLSEDQNSGDVRGISISPQTMEAAAGVEEDGEVYDLRWDATRAYLHPIEDRENLIFVKGTVQKLVWDETKEKDGLVAKGVEVIGADGDVEVLEATNEIVLSAGAYRSPGILEASGVGNPR